MATPAVKRAKPRRETGEASFYCRASRRFRDGHVHYVYVLLCGDGHLYTGYSSNLRERVRQHERGEVFSTKSCRPARLIFYEALFHAADAKR
jgi:putative endonuclease